MIFMIREKVTVDCRADDPKPDVPVSVHCDVFRNDKKTGVFDVTVDPRKGDMKAQVRAEIFK